MIITRTPFRVSFLGGGTDLPGFYTKRTGRVISTAIDKYVYVVINHTPLLKNVSVRYSISESVGHPSLLQHNVIREALLEMGIHSNIEIGYFGHLPVKTGLGFSSSLSVGMMKGLSAYQGKKMDAGEAAEAACRLEIERLREPVGKQDHYAAAFGGFNVFEFNQDGSVGVDPVFLDYKKRFALEDRLLIFFTGITRLAAGVLAEQKVNIPSRFETLCRMADSVFEFRERLASGDFEGLGSMLHQGWTEKKTLASSVSNSILDALYDAGMNYGAWGGKVLGAGGGGCIMFLLSPEKKDALRYAMKKTAGALHLEGMQEIPVHFVQSGSEVVFKGRELHGMWA